eukprot:5270614-Lingulodinium_polyedra.AAC.1
MAPPPELRGTISAWWSRSVEAGPGRCIARRLSAGARCSRGALAHRPSSHPDCAPRGHLGRVAVLRIGGQGRAQ